MRFGNVEKGGTLFITGMAFLLLVVYVNTMLSGQQVIIPFWYSLVIILGIFIMFMGYAWIALSVHRTRANVAMDAAKPEEVKVYRITRDGIILMQFAPKGTFGTVETLGYGEDIDFEDMGEFPLRTLDGSPAVLVFDMHNVAINPKRSIARKYMRKHVSDGVDGYKLWKKHLNAEDVKASG